jgi:hypothetical protein
MRKIETILKVVTSTSDYITWLGLVKTNIPDHDLYNAIALTTVAEYTMPLEVEV